MAIKWEEINSLNKEQKKNERFVFIVLIVGVIGIWVLEAFTEITDKVMDGTIKFLVVWGIYWIITYLFKLLYLHHKQWYLILSIAEDTEKFTKQNTADSNNVDKH